MGFRLLVERLGRQVDAIRPHDSSCLWIDRNLSEIGRVVQRREDACPPFGREVDIPGCTVTEQEAKHAVTNHGDAHDSWQVVLAHTLMLRQRLDTEQGLIPPGPFPVRPDLLLPEDCPFPDKLQGPRFEAAGEHLPARRD